VVVNNKKKIVGFLQNAWSGFYAGETWPRESWLKALARCRSGQRLAYFASACGSDIEIWWDNTTPIVGATPNSVVPPDTNHMLRVVHAIRPTSVVAFGKQAEKALLELQVTPLLILPHPACRVVTNKLYCEAGRLIKEGFSGVKTLKATDWRN
jgi:hypothetical protein